MDTKETRAEAKRPAWAASRMQYLNHVPMGNVIDPITGYKNRPQHLVL